MVGNSLSPYKYVPGILDISRRIFSLLIIHFCEGHGMLQQVITLFGSFIIALILETQTVFWNLRGFKMIHLLKVGNLDLQMVCIPMLMWIGEMPLKEHT